ncbi:unnamed protein product [Euphydryas editha]|uniref:Uncharacterized protein n=1 Tax=Euphydryas editha TaxID=104508 RepID=A0AAU9TD60_EUPED|nr:unnamed protein product [Euphydryas editha]
MPLKKQRIITVGHAPMFSHQQLLKIHLMLTKRHAMSHYWGNLLASRMKKINKEKKNKKKNKEKRKQKL